jgi:hypothetical protein
MDQRVSVRAPQIPLKLGYFSHVFKTLRNNEKLTAKRFGAGEVAPSLIREKGGLRAGSATQTVFNELTAPRKD